jgi:hypothetical protein
MCKRRPDRVGAATGAALLEPSVCPPHAVGDVL